MTLKEQYELRQRQWDEFHRWEAEQPPIDRDPASIIADLGTILRWVSHDERLHDPDPEKIGVLKMRAAMAFMQHHE